MQAPGADDSRNNPAGPDDDVAIVIPTLNEATVMPRLLRVLGILTPAPAEVIVVDGGSQDNTGALVRESGVARLIEHSVRGRAAAINRGVAEACAPLICVLHADTTLPDDAVAVIRATMRDSKTALAGFATIIVGAERVRWGTTFHNLIKTWYAPLIFRPHLFFKGGRLLFGDHAMFFRRSDFVAVGGCDETLTVMEDADLCLRLHRRGRVRLVNRIVTTSDRRIAAWGGLKANLVTSMLESVGASVCAADSSAITPTSGSCGNYERCIVVRAKIAGCPGVPNDTAQETRACLRAGTSGKSEQVLGGKARVSAQVSHVGRCHAMIESALARIEQAQIKLLRRNEPRHMQTGVIECDQSRDRCRVAGN